VSKSSVFALSKKLSYVSEIEFSRSSVGEPSLLSLIGRVSSPSVCKSDSFLRVLYSQLYLSSRYFSIFSKKKMMKDISSVILLKSFPEL
jgi:hypothetical protein